MLSVYNLIDTKNDISPIINNAGNINGKMQYSINIEAFDKDEETDQLVKLNLMDYDSMEDLIGKKMKLTVDIRKAMGIPEKFTYMTKCKYDLFEGQERYETEEI